MFLARVHRKPLCHWLVLGLLLWVFVVLLHNANAQSPTMDEQNHIARGYALLRTGDPRLSVEHPPFINGLEALPLLLLHDLHIPTEDWAWDVGEWYRFADLFLWQMENPVPQIIFLARLPIVILTVLLVALVHRWARELWGPSAGLFALALVALDPNVLAHGSLSTTDLGQTWAVFLAGYTTWRVLQLSERGRVPWLAYTLTGLVMGVMLASKLSSLIFWGVFGFVLALGTAPVRIWGGGAQNRDAMSPPAISARSWLRWGLGMLLVVALALGFLWTVYAFQVAPILAGGRALPLGIYAQGVRSIFQQAQGGRPAYLFGCTTVHGSWLYFPVVFAIKTPLATLLALILAVPAMWRRRAWRVNVFLLLPVFVYWAAAIQSALNLGYRHLLPVLPFMYVWAAQSVDTKRIANVSFANWVERCLKAWWPVFLMLLLLIECLSITPYYLAYFNVLGGGPKNGWRIVADSNIDWGQDLIRLRDVLARPYKANCPFAAGADVIKLSWFGSAPPSFYGIEYEPLPGLPHHFDLWAAPPFDVEQPEPGIYVISVSNLVEVVFEDKGVFTYFREREPDARVGYSVYIYEVCP